MKILSKMDGCEIELTGTIPSNTPLKVNAAASQSAVMFLISDSGGTPRFYVTSAGVTVNRADSQPGYASIYNGIPGASAVALANFLAYGLSVGTTAVIGGSFAFQSDAAWTSTSTPTAWVLQLCAPGSTSRTNRFAVGSSGDVYFNYSGAALATSATKGFSHLGSTTDVPTGVPGATVAGATPLIADNGNNTLWANLNSQWLSFGPGRRLVGSTVNYTSTPQSDIVEIALSGSAAVTLPALSTVPVGKVYEINGINQTASSKTLTLTPNGTDQINSYNGNFTRTIPAQDAVTSADGVAGWRIYKVSSTKWRAIPQ